MGYIATIKKQDQPRKIQIELRATDSNYDSVQQLDLDTSNIHTHLTSKTRGILPRDTADICPKEDRSGEEPGRHAKEADKATKKNTY